MSGPLLLVAAALTLLGDFLFWGYAPGVSAALYAAAVLAALLLVFPQEQGRRSWGPVALAGGLAVQAALDINRVGLILLPFLLLTVAAARLLAETRLVHLGRRGFELATTGWLTLPKDIAALSKENDELKSKTARGVRAGFRWIGYLPIPIVLGALFLLLLTSGNVAFKDWTLRGWEGIAEFLGDLFRNISIARVLFWGALLTVLYGTFAGRIHSPKGTVVKMTRAVDPVAPKPARAWDPLSEHRVVDLSLVVLNLLYFLNNLAEGIHLWGGRPLPETGDYAEYASFARHGSYQLIVAVLLAGMVLALAFRLETRQSGSARSRILAYLWIAQNLFVLLSAGRRLAYHVEGFGLSRLRVSTYIWLGMVLAGFVFLTLKIRHAQPFRQLFARNAVATFFVLYFASFLNIDGIVARYNVAVHESGTAITIDMPYLRRLGEDALPGLVPLLDSGNPMLVARTRDHLRRWRGILADASTDWRWRTVRRMRTLRLLETLNLDP